jgi:hypothetical protein
MKLTHSLWFVTAAIFVTVETAFADCMLTAARPWAKGIVITATTSGKSCIEGEVELQIGKVNGKPAYDIAFKIKDLLTFQDLKTDAAFKQGLSDWIAEMPNFKTAEKLPIWPKGLANKGEVRLPKDAEFAFTPDAKMTRATYDALRKNKAPYFCFVAGSEHQHCLGLSRVGKVIEIGDQAFPG